MQSMNQTYKLSAFLEIVTNYRISVFAYRNFLSQVESYLSTLDQGEQEVYSHLLDSITADLSEEDRAHIRGAVTEIYTLSPSTRTSMLREVSQRLSGDYPYTLWVPLLQLLHALPHHTPVEQHRELLYRGIVTGLVGQFEVLIAELAHAFYRRAPDAVGADEKLLSVNDLKRFGSIDDALDFVVSNRVEDLLRGSVHDWQKFFSTRLKIDLSQHAPDWERFVESIQRRHVIVHAGGRITRRYLENVAPAVVQAYFADASLGTRISLDADYISACVRSFEITGLLLGYHCWSKLHDEELSLMEEDLNENIYALLCAKEWKTVRALALWASHVAGLSSQFRIACQMNYWQASKHLGLWNEVRRDVENFDCSALRPVYALARAALLEDADQFFWILDDADGAQMDRRAWLEWPIFAPIRSDQRFNAYLRRYVPELVQQGTDASQPFRAAADNPGST
jgi:hypothetical protein